MLTEANLGPGDLPSQPGARPSGGNTEGGGAPGWALAIADARSFCLVRPGASDGVRGHGNGFCSRLRGQRFFYTFFLKIWLSLGTNQDHGVIPVELPCSRLRRKALMLDLVLLLST